MILFNVKWLENGTRQSYSYNGRPTETHIMAFCDVLAPERVVRLLRLPLATDLTWCGVNAYRRANHQGLIKIHCIHLLLPHSIKTEWVHLSEMWCVLQMQLGAGRLWFVRCLDNQVNNNILSHVHYSSVWDKHNIVYFFFIFLNSSILCILTEINMMDGRITLGRR